MTTQEIIKTIKYLNFCGLCTTGDCNNCARKISKEKILSLLELEREMIDEKKLIEDIEEWNNEREIKWTFESIINLLESAHRINNWIPCNNKLPELNEGNDAFKQSECVLVTIKWYVFKRGTGIQLTFDIKSVCSSKMFMVTRNILIWKIRQFTCKLCPGMIHYV